MPAAASGPLDGIRVLDLTSVVLGPYATMLLGDLGAEVVKVEPPDGDSMRYAGRQRHPAMGSVSLTLGRNKRSVCLDLKRPEAREALRALVPGVDVVVHNIRREPAARLGLAYEQLRPLNPGLVYAVALGFGDGGPYAGQPAYDDLVQGLSGAVSLMERVAGEPSYVPMIFVDKTTGLALANAILAALVHRGRTGEGQEVAVPMFETMAAYALVEHLADAVWDDDETGAPGYARVLSPHRRPYRTRDGHVCALPYLDKHFDALFALVDRPDLAADPRFASITTRAAHIDEVYAIVADLLATRTTGEWLAGLGEAGVPVGPVNRLDDLFDDPHLRAVGFWQEVQHPTEGLLRQPGVTSHFSATPGGLRRPAPRLGEHTAEVLREAGMPEEQVSSLLASGAAFDAAGGSEAVAPESVAPPS
jgi:crotonobetainyl-CoA:carnitine CoA-transferase CaiB-like acyl-CoA transferase